MNFYSIYTYILYILYSILNAPFGVVLVFPPKFALNDIHGVCAAQLSMRGGLKPRFTDEKWRHCGRQPFKGWLNALCQSVPIHVTIYSCCCKVTYLCERFTGRQSHFVVQDLILRLHVSVSVMVICDWVGLPLYLCLASQSLRRSMGEPSTANNQLLFWLISVDCLTFSRG